MGSRLVVSREQGVQSTADALCAPRMRLQTGGSQHPAAGKEGHCSGLRLRLRRTAWLLSGVLVRLGTWEVGRRSGAVRGVACRRRPAIACL